MRRLKEQGPFTTDQLAYLFNVTAKTVARWIDTKILEGYRMPGKSRRRLVTRPCVQKFLADHPDMPWPDIFVEDAGTI